MTKPIGAIVLAAGFSKRFGDSKLLAQLHNGNTVVQQTLERIAEVFPHRIVVTRPELMPQLLPLAPGTSFLAFEHAGQGMGATLAFAAQHIGDWRACLVCLGDMPFIEASTYRLIAEQVEEDSIVIPVLDSKTGNPVAFGSAYFDELVKLEGDTGGRKLTTLHQNAVRELSVDDPGVLQDIDTPEDLARYQES
ncbi:MAG: nucleotidyltransferase family protein [Gammaproteobacteria bacterium]|nr:nucleotidyltransferase family protein [Gammaproteobacteria bacterium]MDG2339346.1 nucleotidyltransferase family protein [Gammaproteobacteria bacterium]